MFDDYAFVRPEVTVEFGARSTGEPRVVRPVECDAAPYLPDLLFPRARPSVMLAERTFWEKATAIHIFCRQERKRGERLSRHWHDLARLDDAGVAARALADRAIARSVARHKSIFFREKDAAGNEIDYHGAVSGGLQLIPSGPARDVLADDYAQNAGRRHAARCRRALRTPDGALCRHRGQGKRAGRPRRLSAMLEISPRRCRKQKIPIRWI